jgi:hypothetical protein
MPPRLLDQSARSLCLLPCLRDHKLNHHLLLLCRALLCRLGKRACLLCLAAVRRLRRSRVPLKARELEVPLMDAGILQGESTLVGKVAWK